MQEIIAGVNRLPIYRLAVPGDELEDVVLSLLRGRVFHATSPSALAGIIKEGHVRSNADARFRFTKPQSEKNYGRRNGMPCLFDLRRVSALQLAEALPKLYFVNLFSGHTIFLILRRAAEAQLQFPPHSLAEVNYQYVWIPHVEAYYPTDLPVDQIELALDVTVVPNWSAASHVQYERLLKKLSNKSASRYAVHR